MGDEPSTGGDGEITNRRDLLRALTGVGAAGLGGCSLAGDDGTPTGDGETPDPDGDAPGEAPVLPADTALPPSFEGKHLVAEWGLGWLKYVSFDEDGEVTEIDPFLPGETFTGPIDMAVGPGGELYLLEFGGWQGVDGSRLSRIDHDW